LETQFVLSVRGKTKLLTFKLHFMKRDAFDGELLSFRIRDDKISTKILLERGTLKYVNAHL